MTGHPFSNNIVITMSKHLEVSIRPIGNSHGVVIPKMILEQLGFDKKADMFIKGDQLILTKPAQTARAGWHLSAIKISEASEDQLVMGEFANDDDKDLTW